METTKTFQELFEEVEKKMQALTEGNSYVRQLNVYTKPSWFCPYMQFVTIDALEKKDYPHGIDRNSIYLTFEINHSENKVRIFDCGHIYLSKTDKQSEKYKYLAMKSMIDVHTDFGGKKFRKTKYKNISDLVEKMNDYFVQVMIDVDKYTGGYPYKEGI